MVSVLAVLALLGVAHFFFMLQAMKPVAMGFQDTQIFVEAALNWYKGDKLYTLKEPLYITYAPSMAVFKFSPVYILPYIPWLGVIEGPVRDTLYAALYYIHIIRYLIAGALLFFFFGPWKNPFWTLALVTVFGLAAPVYESLWGMTFENLLLLLTVMAAVLLRYQRTWMASTLIAYAVLAKFYPAAFLIYFLAANRWKVLFNIGVMIFVILAASILIIGAEAHQDYFLKLLPVMLREDANMTPFNASLIYTVLADKTLRVGASLTTVLVSFLVINLTAKRDTAAFDPLQFAFAVTVPLLLLKNSWSTYQILLLIPIAVLLGQGLQEKGILARMKIIMAVVATIPLIASDNYSLLSLWYLAHTERSHWFAAIHAQAFQCRMYSTGFLWCGMAVLLLCRRIFSDDKILHPK